MPGRLKAFLCRELGLFVTDNREPRGGVDIVMEHLPDLPDPGGVSHRPATVFGFRVIRDGGWVAAVFDHRGRPDVMVVFSDPVKIVYRDRKGIERRVYAMVLFSMMLVLKKKNRMFCHGAVVRHRDKAFLLAGPRGTGKTMVVLSLLRRGWDYVSDDKFLLWDNRAHIFQPFLVLRGHHFSFLPWLEGLNPAYEGFARKARQQKNIRTQLTPFVPGKLLASLDRFLNPCIRVRADAFSRETRIHDSAGISAGILLGHGRGFSAARISRREFIHGFGLIQQLAAREFSDLERMLYYHDSGLENEPKAILEQNITADTFVRITVPPVSPPDAMAREVVKCLEQL